MIFFTPNVLVRAVTACLDAVYAGVAYMSPWHVTPHVEDTLTTTPPLPPDSRDMFFNAVLIPW